MQDLLKHYLFTKKLVQITLVPVKGQRDTVPNETFTPGTYKIKCASHSAHRIELSCYTDPGITTELNLKSRIDCVRTDRISFTVPICGQSLIVLNEHTYSTIILTFDV